MSCVFNSARSRIWLIWTAVTSSDYVRPPAFPNVAPYPRALTLSADGSEPIRAQRQPEETTSLIGFYNLLTNTS